MSQPSSAELLLEQVDALMNEDDIDLFFTPSRRYATTSSSAPLTTPATTPRSFQNKTPTPLSTGSADSACPPSPSGRSLAQRPVASPSTTRPSYPTKWTKGHDEALIIFAASLSLLHRQYLQKLPFFEPWSGYGWSHLSNHLRKAMRNSLRDQGCSFDLPNLSKGSSGGASLPDEIVQAMEQAIMRGAEGAASPAGTFLHVTPRRRPKASTSSQSPLAKKSSGKRRLQAGALPALASEEEDLADLDSTASSAGLQTPPPLRAKRPKRSSAGKQPAALSTLKGLTSSDDEEENSLCLETKKRRRLRESSTDSALDELWQPQTPTVVRTSRRKGRESRTRPPAWTSVKTPTRPSARPLVQTSTSPLAPTQDAAREGTAASPQLVRAEPMCIDLTLSEED